MYIYIFLNYVVLFKFKTVKLYIGIFFDFNILNRFYFIL